MSALHDLRRPDRAAAVALLSPLLVLAAFAAPVAAQPVNAGFAVAPPTLDGVLGPGEWQSAAVIPLTLSSCGEQRAAELRIMNDLSAVHFAIVVFGDEVPDSGAGESIEVGLAFDENGDGVQAAGDHGLSITCAGAVRDLFSPPSSSNPFQLLSDTVAAGSADVSGAVTFAPAVPGQPGDMIMEFSHPLDSGDNLDPAWQPGSLLRLAAFHREIVPGQANCFASDPGPVVQDWILVQLDDGSSWCPEPEDLTATADCLGTVIDVTWSSPITYAAITVEVFDDATGALLLSEGHPGSATSTTVDPGLAGRLRVRVVGGCPSGGDVAAEVAVLVAPFLPGDTNAVFSLEKPGGLIDSAGALAADLGGIGKDVIVLDDILDFACRDQMGPGTVAWVMLGTWPENHVLTVEEGAALVELLLAGVSIYIEGADHWGFDPPTPFRDYDGILGTSQSGNVIDDGDDSLTALVGLQFDTLDFTGNSGLYEQDSPGNDSNDRLQPTGSVPGIAPDLLGINAGVVWESSQGYGVAVLYVPDLPGIPFVGGNQGPKILGSGSEYGGYCGDDVEVTTKMSISLKGITDFGEFLRGDCNDDGTCDLADMIFLLSHLFLGGPGGTCAAACDVNDDDIVDLADAIAKFTFLFTGGAPPPPPSGACGFDPTPGSLTCDFYGSCP